MTNTITEYSESSESAEASFSITVKKGLETVKSSHRLLLESLDRTLVGLGESRAAALVCREFKDALQDGFEASDVQAMSCYFQLLNIAEEYASNEAKLNRETEAGFCAEPGHWGSYLQRLRAQGVTAEDARKALPLLEVEPVFTKHPTEAKRWSVLRIHREMLEGMSKVSKARTEFEREGAQRALDALMERLWMTGEVYSKKPSVQDEVQNLLYYLTEIIPSTQARLDARLRYAWKKTWPDSGPLDETELPSVRLGTWVGGDRDGHPFVTADVTRQTLAELRKSAIQLLRKRLEALADKLAFTATQTPPPQGLIDYLVASGADMDTVAEPWRRYVDLAIGELNDSDIGSLKERLTNLREWFEKAGAVQLASEEVGSIERFLGLVGLHLARMDARQNSAYYERALTQLLIRAGVENAASYQDWPSERKRALLESELSNPRPLAHSDSDLPMEAKETLAYLRVLREQIETHGIESLGTLIVSMTRCVEDLLTVYLLCKEAELFQGEYQGAKFPLVVAPLFETYDDLKRAPSIMEEYLKHPLVKRSLPKGKLGLPQCIVMLGYSDSNKDVGILASQWALRRTQELLLEIGEANGVSILFFHGRGGTVSRGAGPTHRFLEALPKGSLKAGLRLTEQGEVIGQKYNSLDTASSQIETLLAGTFGSSLLAEKNSEDPRFEEALDALASYSRIKYRELLEMEGFLTFYRQATPIDAIELSRIGSRPSRRTGQPTLADLRAIPWVFSWNQSRFYLPGWYGVGTALEKLRIENPLAYQFVFEEMQASPFIRYVFYNVESSLASSSEKWMKRYASLVSDEVIRDRFLDTILSEWKRTDAELRSLLGEPLKQRRPRFWSTLQERQIPLDTLHAKQIDLLRASRVMGDLSKDPSSVESLLLLINAIASGLRTTG